MAVVIAKVFRNGRNQAIRIPTEFSLDTDRVTIEKQGDALTDSQVLRLESQIHYHARDPEACARAAGQAMEIAREANLHYETALNAHNMGEAFLRLGDYRRAFAGPAARVYLSAGECDLLARLVGTAGIVAVPIERDVMLSDTYWLSDQYGGDRIPWGEPL